MGPVVVCTVGTRPEAVKMAPVIARLRREAPAMRVRVLTTGQHRGLLDRALGDFGIVSDHDLALMRPDQGLADLTARAITAVSAYLEHERPDIVLAQGDTTTVLCTALACYYNRIPFGHVEAGLRTGRPFDPFPEEKNRVLADHLAALHFAPTPGSRANLLREGIEDGTISVTGNTVIDALREVSKREPALPLQPATPRFLLVTAHRRESFGAPLQRICRALRDLVTRHPALSVVYPVHPNPNVRSVVEAELGGRERMHLIAPTTYPQFFALMNASFAILTDSGGVQEEAPSLGKPVLVLRETTERPEAVEAGAARVVGTERAGIVAAVEELLDDPACYARYATAANPFGDGWASDRIVRALAKHLGLAPSPLPAHVPESWAG